MTRPATLYTWATDALYTGGPAVGTATKSAPSGGLQAQGWDPGDEPAAQNFNALFSNFTSWVAWLNGQQSGARTELPRILVPGDWTPTTPGTLSYVSSGGSATGGYFELNVPEGNTLTSFSINAQTASSSQISIGIGNVDKDGTTHFNDTGDLCLFAQSLTTSPADYVFNTNAQSLGIPITTDGAGHYVRSTGSFITDGFFPGMDVLFSGFANGANNGIKFITAVSATTLSEGTPTTVTEGPVTASASTPNNLFTSATRPLLYLAPNASHAIHVNSVRYTWAPSS